ncbi:MAG: rRNA maturation RNase YbeY [Paraglaciecola sp.]|nr:rRNA maturation RNase YbeY [Paraglaciecola sp.]NCT49173.1 rRNA maturation RNase YbeY [Paraglaciecola sp.]
MPAILDLQIASDATNLPDERALMLWLNTVLSALSIESIEITVRIVDEQESQQLNSQYRGKNSSTNVLSFVFEQPDFATDENNTWGNYAGDLIICAPVVAREAHEQGKQLLHHWAHMLVHGTLHLLGYDHIDDDEVEEMETLERQILLQLAIDDPYENH